MERVVGWEGFINDSEHQSEAELRPYIQWYVRTNQKDGTIDYEQQEETYAKFGITRKDMENFDYFISNNGSLEDFYKKIDGFIEYFEQFV